jgi:hypothetical protein
VRERPSFPAPGALSGKGMPPDTRSGRGHRSGVIPTHARSVPGPLSPGRHGVKPSRQRFGTLSVCDTGNVPNVAPPRLPTPARTSRIGHRQVLADSLGGPANQQDSEEPYLLRLPSDPAARAGPRLGSSFCDRLESPVKRGSSPFRVGTEGSLQQHRTHLVLASSRCGSNGCRTLRLLDGRPGCGATTPNEEA